MTEIKNIYPIGPRHRFLAMIICAAAVMVLFIAWMFQIIGGFHPCPLCLEQRYAYYVAVPLSIIVYFGAKQNWPSFVVRCFFILLALSFFYSAVTGIYQAGAEWEMWQGPSECGGATLGGERDGDLMAQMANTHIIRCDKASWRFLSLSFAGWNMMIAMTLAIISLISAFIPGEREEE